MSNGHDLGAYIKRRRMELGDISQQAVARAMARALGHTGDDYLTVTGRFQKLISRLEKGESESIPDAETLAAMAEALDTVESDLLREMGFLRDQEDDTDEQRIWTAMMRDIDRLNLPPHLKNHMRQTAKYVRELAEGDKSTG